MRAAGFDTGLLQRVAQAFADGGDHQVRRGLAAAALRQAHAQVAGPVGESLLMTAIGLAVAVPAVLGYNWLVRRNKVTMDAVRSFAADVHGVLMGAKSVR